MSPESFDDDSSPPYFSPSLDDVTAQLAAAGGWTGEIIPWWIYTGRCYSRKGPLLLYCCCWGCSVVSYYTDKCFLAWGRWPRYHRLPLGLLKLGQCPQEGAMLRFLSFITSSQLRGVQDARSRGWRFSLSLLSIHQPLTRSNLLIARWTSLHVKKLFAPL